MKNLIKEQNNNILQVSSKLFELLSKVLKSKDYDFKTSVITKIVLLNQHIEEQEQKEQKEHLKKYLEQEERYGC